LLRGEESRRNDASLGIVDLNGLAGRFYRTILDHPGMGMEGSPNLSISIIMYRHTRDVTTKEVTEGWFSGAHGLFRFVVIKLNSFRKTFERPAPPRLCLVNSLLRSHRSTINTSPPPLGAHIFACDPPCRTNHRSASALVSNALLLEPANPFTLAWKVLLQLDTI
jgi:hypothetical protein